MLYLHCGWPRTGTTSFQQALYRRRGDLAAAGTVFPLRWMSDISPTHHGLSELLEALRTGSTSLDEFKAFLAANDGVDVLFSAESITYWLTSETKQDVLLTFLAAALEVTPVKCMWTLRRIDDQIRSLYLLVMSNRPDVPSPAAQYRVTTYLAPLFVGMRRVGEAVGGDVAYLEYDSVGTHQIALMTACGIDKPIADLIHQELVTEHLNASLTHKQAALLANLKALSVRAGVDLRRGALCRALREGELQFENDCRCELVDSEARRELHEHALAAARTARFSPYLDFFEDAEIPEVAATVLAPEALTDRDIAQLVALCDARRGSRAENVRGRR